MSNNAKYLILCTCLLGGFLALFIFFLTKPQESIDENYGAFKTCKVISALTVNDQKYYLKIESDNGPVSIEVEQDQCYEFDSIEVKLIGEKYKVRIREKHDCYLDQDSTNFEPNIHLRKGVNFSKKRCFTTAIEHYSKGIELDSTYSDFYYSRGLNYMFKKDYEAAILDLITGYSLIDTKQFDKTSIYNLLSSNQTLISNKKKLIQQVELVFSTSNNMKKFAHFDKAFLLSSMNDYQRRIIFCFGKLKNNT